MSEPSEEELRRRRVAVAFLEDEDWRKRNRSGAPSKKRDAAESKKVVNPTPLPPSHVSHAQHVVIAVRNLTIGDRQLFNGQEIPPDLFSPSEIDRRLDCGDLAPCKTRRSLFRLLHKFSKCSESDYSEEHRQYRL
jgi:hypothetical protein